MRELIEQTRSEDLDTALRALVLAPLGIAGPRIAMTRADLADVAMHGRAYHPGWVYHGLMVGRLADAALLLERLLTGDLLPPALHAAMRRTYTIGADMAGRWRAVGYGLGLVCGTARNGCAVCGHTGGGPGSVVAIYRVMAEPAFTAAAFAAGEDPAGVEEAVFDRGRAPPDATPSPI